MTNFDFLKSNPQFASFADVAISAEKILQIDASASVLNCRRAMEFAVKWMYSVDKDLEMPYDTTLISLMKTDEFRDVIGTDLYRRMDFIRKAGNIAAHGGKRISLEQAKLCIENLFYFLDYIAFCYGNGYEGGDFDESLLELTTEEALSFVTEKTLDLDALVAENVALKDELTARRAEHQLSYVPKPLEISEFNRRKVYFDTMLSDEGREEGESFTDEEIDEYKKM